MWRVTLHNVTLYTTCDKLPLQLQIISGANDSESMPHENPAFRGPKISGHVLDEGYFFQKEEYLADMGSCTDM